MFTLFKIKSTKAKNSLVNFLNLDKREVISINEIELYLQKEYILSSDFTQYCNKDSYKKSSSYLWSKIICIFCWIITMRWLLCVFISNPTLLILMSDPLYLTGDRKLCNLIVFGLSLSGSLLRTLFIIGLYEFLFWLTLSKKLKIKFIYIKGENKQELYFVHHLFALKNNLNHCLSATNLRKIQILSKFTVSVVFKLLRFNATLTFGIVCGIYLLMAYIKQDYNYSLILMIIWFLIIMLEVWNITSILAFTYGITFLVIYYLKLRFK